jgi:hypothetical protein
LEEEVLQKVTLLAKKLHGILKYLFQSLEHLLAKVIRIFLENQPEM